MPVAATLFRARRESPPSLPYADRLRQRATSVDEPAKLMAGGRAELCIVREVCSTGIKVAVYRSVTIGAEATVELRTGHRLTGIVAPAPGGEIAIGFAEPMPVLSMLSHCSFDPRVIRIRPPRLDVDLPGVLRILGERLELRIRDVSQAGMKLAFPEELPLEARCMIETIGLTPQNATVRWNRGGHSGILLDRPMEFARFGAWRALLEREEAEAA